MNLDPLEASFDLPPWGSACGFAMGLLEDILHVHFSQVVPPALFVKANVHGATLLRDKSCPVYVEKSHGRKLHATSRAE